MSIVRVVITGLILGQKCQNVLHFLNPDGSLAHDAIRDDLITHWINNLKTIQNAGLSYTQMTVQTVADTPDVMSIFPLTGLVGSLSGEAAPTFVGGLFSLRTGVPGRRGHGRFYMFGVHMDSIENGVVQSSALTAYAVVAAALFAAYGDPGGSSALTLMIGPRSNDSTDYLTVTTIIPRAIFGVVRRRNIGVGG